MSHHSLYVVRFHTEKERGKGNPSTHLEFLLGTMFYFHLEFLLGTMFLLPLLLNHSELEGGGQGRKEGGGRRGEGTLAGEHTWAPGRGIKILFSNLRRAASSSS